MIDLGRRVKLSINALMRFLSSMRLAVVLIVFLAASSAVSTFVPQGHDQEFYREVFPMPIADLILFFRADSFFRSPLFFAASGLFFLNLLLCTIRRLRRVRTGRSIGSWGPDFIHIGILLLLAGGLMTAYGRSEQVMYLTEGRSIRLPDGKILTAESLRYLSYGDGRPRDWLTTVRIGGGDADERAGESERSFTIEVNRPLRTDGLKIYQHEFYHTGVLSLEKDGAGYSLMPDRTVTTRDGLLRFLGVVSNTGSGLETYTGMVGDGSVSAVFEEWKGSVLAGEKKVTAGERVGDYRLKAIFVFPVSGLKIVRDPGYVPIVLALIFVCVGLGLTFFMKLRARPEIRPARTMKEAGP